MMINKRLIGMVSESKKFVAGNVAMQWCSLAANIGLMFTISNTVEKVYNREIEAGDYGILTAVFVGALLVRFLCEKGAAKMSFEASHSVKRKLREKIYEKLLRIGVSYNEKVSSAEVVQVAVEGVDQLETYFGAYLPQFFYSMLAPFTLFLVLSFVDILSALVLLICVPMIPVTIIVIQRWAKRLLSKYWGQYTALGDTFLENLQGLTTLKIYKTDEMKHKEMNEQAEQFRKITMKVLTMQLNSITVMDLVTYGGTALGMILAVLQLHKGNVSLAGCLVIILLSADYFIPMRRLGSFFHIAMNGMAACDKIFKLLDIPEEHEKTALIGQDKHINVENLTFSYEENHEILHNVAFDMKEGTFVALVGESGCGKSTIAGLLLGKNKGYQGSITIGGIEISEIQEENLMRNITGISHNSYLFKGTVRENLLMGKPDATDEEMLEVLKKVKLYEFLMEEQGLETELLEKASNLSGGQCQRLALARALLHDTPIYIFDEATSNIDVESEEAIMEQIYCLAKEKTVILISHRLANVVEAAHIIVLADGKIAEQGTHEVLMKKHGTYANMMKTQMELENYGKGCA